MTWRRTSPPTPLRLLLLLLAASACSPAKAPPATAQRVWLEPARVYGGPVYFADEVLPIADAVARSLRARGFAVIAPEETRAQWAAVQQGMLPGRAARCEAAPPPARLSAVVYRGAWRAELEVRCEQQGCELQVVLMEPGVGEGDDEREAARFRRSLPAGQTPAQWAQAIEASPLQRVSPPPPEGGLGVGGLLMPGRQPGTYAIVHGARHIGPWAAPIDSATLQPLAETLKGCKQPTARWRDWWGQQFVLEVHPSGKVSRCEYSLPDRLPPPGFACECAVLRTVDFGPAHAARRASFYLDITTLSPAPPASPAPPLYHRAYLLDRRSSDPSATLGTAEVDSAAITRCLQAVTEPTGELQVPVIFSVGADGRATRYEAQWPPALSPPVRECVGAELGRAWFTCPLSGSARVAAKLHLEVQAR